MADSLLDHNTTSPSEPVKSPWDYLLSKYVRVWIWSVIVGVNSGLAYSYIGLQPTKAWYALSSLLLIVMAFGCIASFLSWWALLVHLRVALIPEFFGYGHSNDSRRSARTLERSYQFFIIAAMARLIFALIEFAFQLLG